MQATVYACCIDIQDYPISSQVNSGSCWVERCICNIGFLFLAFGFMVDYKMCFLEKIYIL